MKMNFVSDLAGRQTLHDGSGTRRVKARRDPAATLHEFSRLIGVSPTSVRRIFFGDLERPKEAFQAGRKIYYSLPELYLWQRSNAIRVPLGTI